MTEADDWEHISGPLQRALEALSASLPVGVGTAAINACHAEMARLENLVVGMAAKIERLEWENKNLVPLLEIQTAKSEDLARRIRHADRTFASISKRPRPVVMVVSGKRGRVR